VIFRSIDRSLVRYLTHLTAAQRSKYPTESPSSSPDCGPGPVSNEDEALLGMEAMRLFPVRIPADQSTLRSLSPHIRLMTAAMASGPVLSDAILAT
jgi:hypothetical protein